MSHSTLLRRCYDFVEAEALKTRLDAAGILAVVNGAEAHIAFSYFGMALGGVRVEVAPEDFDRAVQLLDEDDRKAAVLGPWICEACQEQNEATFEVCWNCQKPRDADDAEGRLPEQDEQPDLPASPPTAEPPKQSTVDTDQTNPYRPVLLEPEKPEKPTADIVVSPAVDEEVRRAYGAAVLGTVLLPPLLNLYSVWLLTLSDARAAHRPRKYRSRLALIWTVNVISIVGWSAWWLSFVWQ